VKSVGEDGDRRESVTKSNLGLRAPVLVPAIISSPDSSVFAVAAVGDLYG
jgi:hypothetical protein